MSWFSPLAFSSFSCLEYRMAGDAAAILWHEGQAKEIAEKAPKYLKLLSTPVTSHLWTSEYVDRNKNKNNLFKLL